MGGEDDSLLSAIANVVLCGMSAAGLSAFLDGHTFSWAYPGMHVNYFIHGCLGFMNAMKLGNVEGLYKLSLPAAKYIGLASVLGDIYYRSWGDGGKVIGLAHLASGIIPCVLEISSEENKGMGHLALVLHCLSAAIVAVKRNNCTWAWGLCVASVVTYFVCAPKEGVKPFLWPLGLAVMDHFAYKVCKFSATAV